MQTSGYDGSQRLAGVVAGALVIAIFVVEGTVGDAVAALIGVAVDAFDVRGDDVGTGSGTFAAQAAGNASSTAKPTPRALTAVFPSA